MSNLENKVDDLTDSVARIETKLDLFLPQIKKNTKFRHQMTAIGAFILACGGSLGGYLLFWKRN